MDGQTHTTMVGPDEADRALARAESDIIFRDIVQACLDLVDDCGYPEWAAEAVLGDQRDAIVLFRMYRIAAQVNRGLSGKPAEERLTEGEWRERDNIQRRRAMMEQMQHLRGLDNQRLGQQRLEAEAWEHRESLPPWGLKRSDF